MNPERRSQNKSLSIEPLEGAALASVKAASGGKGILAQHHPLWLDVLADLGEELIGAAAFDGNALAGWIMASAWSGRFGTAVFSLPYVAYGGPALVGPATEAGNALCSWLNDEAMRSGACSIAIGMSPFAEQRELAAAAAAFSSQNGAFQFKNFAQVQPLAPHPLEQLPKRRRDKLLSVIRRAEREGVEVGPCSDPATFDRWLRIYSRRYDELGARPYPDSFHRSAFLRGRDAGIVEFWAAHHADRLVGGTLFLIGTEVVDYFSSAYEMDENTRWLAPNNALLSRAFVDFARRGKSWFNWQSSPSRESGVYKFKAGWGAEERAQVYLGRLAGGAVGQRLLAASPAQINSDYPLRFVVPFGLLARSAETAT